MVEVSGNIYTPRPQSKVKVASFPHLNYICIENQEFKSLTIESCEEFKTNVRAITFVELLVKVFDKKI